jgi:trk system potassium uptake protein TrkH
MVYKVLGSLLFIEAMLLFMCLGMAVYYKEDDLFAFSISLFTTMLVGVTLRYMGREGNNTLSRRDAYLVVSLSWIIFSLFGTLPFMLSGYLTSFTDAFFETMSGFTTTGATVIDNIDEFPHGLLFWRSLTHWIGGLGIVFFTVAFLPSMTGGTVRVFAAEATGPIRAKLHPRLSTSAKWIWTVYTLLTLACILSYYFAGMTPFDALNYAMATTATGGFSTHATSAEYFRSPTVEYLCTLFCFLSGVNFVLFYAAFVKGKWKRLFSSVEFRFYTGVIAVFTLFIMAELIIHRSYDIEHAFRSSLFTVVSFITTTGLFNDDAGTWPHVTWIVLAACMIFGGMSGSTSGGIKCIRGVMSFKVIKNEFKHLLHPNAVLPLCIDGNNVPSQKRTSLMAFLTTYVLLFVIAAFILTLAGIDSTNAVTIILSCLGNVGPTLGLDIGPTMSWAELPVYIKWICSFYMLLGRLEIFSVLVIFIPSFWTEN